MSVEESPVQPVRPASNTHHGRSPGRDLFLISFLLLFFELACIRWFGSTVVFLTFFTNLVLMACFLGSSVGCLAASRPANYLTRVLPLTLLAVSLSLGVLWAYNHFERLTIAVERAPSPQQVFFGTEVRSTDPAHFVVPIEALAAAFFSLIALAFVGIGQPLGRAFDAMPNRVWAYTINIAGSFAGIVAFAAMSYLRAPPLSWFAVSGGLVLLLVPRRTMPQILALAILLLVVGGLAYLEEGWKRTIWSPYSKVQYDPLRQIIEVNNIGHQGLLKIDEAGPAYSLPHLLNRDAGRSPYEDVLIIGAGSGNDVQAALMNGVKHVDAVEIDPVLTALGKSYHPNRPYRDPRVTVHFDDGRSYVRQTDRKYDLVIYAVVDSLALHSGYSTLRLESFLFTEEAFRDIKERLKPNGVFALYNFYRRGWVVGRLVGLLEKVFDAKPLVISLPYKERIEADEAQGMHLTFLMVGRSESAPTPAIREKFLKDRFFWGHKRPFYNQLVGGFGPAPPPVAGTKPEDWQAIGLAAVDSTRVGPLPTDDWPFLYLRSPSIPALNLRGIAIVVVLSLVILACLAPVRTIRPNGQMFFLGAGFMLLETKGVVQMALLFGSTWIVNSIVFGAILLMILGSNLYVLAARPRSQKIYYALLIAFLALEASVPLNAFLALSQGAKTVLSCLLTFLPIAFAGVIFAMSFRESHQPDVDLGSNTGGVILGGVCEYFSLLFGFNGLLYIAIAFYALSAAFARMRSAR
jgi:SAM-dependent methyltransferase